MKLRRDGDSCGDCAVCASFDAGTNPNISSIAPEKGYLKIDQVRELQRALTFKTERGKRVAVVHDADAMQLPAANAFLKTLEEPPGPTVIVLLTSRPAMLLPTILSRCQRINFGPLTTGEISAYLTDVAGVDKGEAGLFASLSLGSLAEALKAAESDALSTRMETLSRVLALAPGDTEALLKEAERLAKDDELPQTLDLLMVWCRDRLLESEGAGELAILSGAARAPARSVRGGFKGLERIFTSLDNARRDIMPPRNANKRLTMETLLMEMVAN